MKLLSSVKTDTTSLSDRAAEQIIRFIQENQLQRGDRLPNERLLESQLGVSRSTIREAMRSLSSRGIVVIRQGSGTYIASSPGVVEDPLGMQFKYNKDKLLLDLLEVRIILEPEIAALCAKRASDEDIREITELAEYVERCIVDGVDHTEHDVAFHCKVAAVTGNDILNVLFPEIVKSIRLFSQVLESRILHTVGEAHTRIAAAISLRDPDLAREAMYAHIVTNKNAIQARIEQNWK